MSRRYWTDGRMRFFVLAVMVLCFLGAVAGMFIVVVRVPSMADTKLERLMGTLQGAAVSLLFAIAGLLINLTFMVRRAELALRVRTRD